MIRSSSLPVYDPELTLSTEEADADLLRFFFLALPTLDWPDPEASETFVPSITFAPSVVMAAILSSVPFELKWTTIKNDYGNDATKYRNYDYDFISK